MQATKYFKMSRPTLLWICVFALAYHFLLYYALCWLAVVAMPPPIGDEKLYALITLTAALCGIRSYDKLKGTDTKSLE